MNEDTFQLTGFATQEGDTTFVKLLRSAAAAGAVDLIVIADSIPCISIDRQWQDLSDRSLAENEVNTMLSDALEKRHRDILDQYDDVDFALHDPQFGRCRINIHRQRRSLAAAIRFIPDTIPPIETLNLPANVPELADLPRGLVLVTGPTGSGKSTTMAAMIDRVNQTRRAHIITLEDPIEYIFTNNRCIIEQREIGIDTPSFASALRHVVRQAPDVIMIGELRDLDTIRTALTAVETGHLVIGSLHTITAAQTIERIVDVFEAKQQPSIRIQLANTLKAVICQTLLTNEATGGLVPVVEMLINTFAIARVIRDNEIHLIPGMIETGRQQGMQTMDSSIADLVTKGVVGWEAAMSRAVNAEQLEKKLNRQASRRYEDTPAAAMTAGPSSSSGQPWR